MRPEIRDGALVLEGSPSYLASAEYPYFRDDRDNWTHRLEELRAIGFRFVTAYVPWRHHEVARPNGPLLDFVGSTAPSRDVVGLLQRCSDLGLMVVAKPGPFVHAELNFGGLPDRVSPLHNTSIEPMRDHRGEVVRWPGGKPLPDRSGLEPWPLPAPFEIGRAHV